MVVSDAGLVEIVVRALLLDAPSHPTRRQICADQDRGDARPEPTFARATEQTLRECLNIASRKGRRGRGRRHCAPCRCLIGRPGEGSINTFVRRVRWQTLESSERKRSSPVILGVRVVPLDLPLTVGEYVGAS